VDVLARAAELDPGNGEIAWRLGTALITAQRPDAAVAPLRRALDLLPQELHFPVRRDLAFANYLRRDFAETLRELAPYFTLAERLGSFLAQLAEGRMAEARLAYGGGLAEQPTDALTLAFLRGLLNVILEERVTDVNAALVARARGLRVVETSTPDSGGFASLLGATLATDRGEWSVAGALFNHREPRIVRIDGYPLEAVPQGWMLVFANLDVPGVVGRIGTLCGRHHINIAGMQLGRERRGGRAVSILNLDDPVPEAVLDEIRAMPDIVLAKLVKL